MQIGCELTHSTTTHLSPLFHRCCFLRNGFPAVAEWDIALKSLTSACHPLNFHTFSLRWCHTALLLHVAVFVQGRVEPASPTELTTSRIEALQVQRPCASSLETSIQTFIRSAQPKTRGPERGSRVPTRTWLLCLTYVGTIRLIT